MERTSSKSESRKNRVEFYLDVGQHTDTNANDYSNEDGENNLPLNDNVLASGDDKTPIRDRDTQLRRKIELTQGPPNKKIGMPIVRSKIDFKEARRLEEKLPKVANGTGNLLGNANGDHLKDDKIPKSLQNLISREKVHPKESATTKNHKIEVTRTTSPTGFNLGSNISVQTVSVSKGVTMKRIDAKVPSAPKSNKRTKTSHDTKKNLDSKVIPSQNAKLKRKDGPTTSNNNFAPPSKSKKISIVTESKPPHQPHHKTNNTQQNQQNSRHNETTSHHSQSQAVAENGSTSGAGENVLPAVESYRTLEEFLHMPVVSFADQETVIPPVAKDPVPHTTTKVSGQGKEKSKEVEVTASSKPQPHTYYKSKFWELLDPKKKQVPSTTEKSKNYDPIAVKTFMDKQREVRKEQKMSESRAQQEQLRRKQKQLKELNEKRMQLLSKTASRSRGNLNNKGKSGTATVDSTSYKLMHKEVENLVNKVVSPARVESHSSTTAKEPLPTISFPRNLGKLSKLVAQLPIANLEKSPNKASILLQEFETIVKRECINFFQTKKDTYPAHTSTSRPVVRADKAVETTESLAGLNHSRSSCSSISTVKSIPSATIKDYQHAASKIQAAFKGYKERKILKEANILPKDLVQIKKLLHLRPQSQGFVVSKVPEKPYDHEATKHLRQRFGNEQKSTYIPPPSPNASAISVKAETSHPQALPFGKIIRKSFNEPYPKEAIQRIQEAQAEASASRRNSMTNVNILNSSFLNDTKGIRNSLDCSGLRSPGNLDTPKGLKKRGSEGMGLRVPSISAVLFEKLRLLENEKKTTKSVSTTSFSTTSEVGLDKDLESVSSITRGSQKLGDSTPPSQDVTITDDYFGPPDSEVRHTRTSTPLKHQRAQLREKQTRSKSSSPAGSSMSAESATTVETDFELVPSNHEAKPTVEARNNVTSSVPYETTTTSGSTIPIPALKLQYLAEKERLNVLEKALQASTNYEHAIKSKPAMNVPTTSQIVEIAKKVADEQIKQSMAQLEKQKLEALIKQQEQTNMGPANSLQLEMMKCQKEAASATAEISKWMADLGKSLIEDRHRRTNEEPLNLATIVYAAVDEAQRIVQAERRNRQEQRQSLQQIEKAQLVASRKKSRETLMVAQRLLEDVSQQFPSFSEQSLPLVSDNLQEETDNSTVASEYEQQHSHVISEQDKSEANIDSSIDASDSNVIRSLLEHAKSFVDEVIDGRSKFSEREGTESIAYEASFLSDVKDKTESVISEPEEKQLGQGLSFADRTESIIPEVSDVTGGKTESIISEEKFLESVSEVECEVGTNLSGDISEPKSESFLSEDQDQKEKSLHLKEEKHAPILTQTSLDKPPSFIELASIKEQSKIDKSEDVSENHNTSFVPLKANGNHDELQFDESLKINEETDLLNDKLESTVPVLEHKEMKEDQQEYLGSPHVKPLENVKKLDDVVVSVVEQINDQDSEEKLDISSEILPPEKGPDEDNETSKENLNVSKVQPIVETIQPLLIKETIPISKGGIAEKSHSSKIDPNTESVSYEVEIEPDISNASSNNVALLDKSIALDQDEDQAKQTVESGMVAQDEMKSVADKTPDENHSAEIKITKERELSSVEDKPFVVVRAPAEMKFSSDLKEMEVIKASEVSSELNRAKDEMLTLLDKKIQSTSNEKEVSAPEEIQIAKISPEIVNLVAESAIASPIQQIHVEVSPTIEAKQIVDIGESCAAQSPEGKEKSEINYSKSSEEPAVVGIAASPAIVIDGDLSAPKEKQIEDIDKSKFPLPEGNQNVEIVMSNESESESATVAKNYEPEKVSERIQIEQLIKDQLSLQLKPVVSSFQNQVDSILSQIENDTHSILNIVNEESSELKLLDISSQLNESQDEEPITPSVKVSAELEALDADSRQEVVGISSQPLSVSASSEKSEQALSDVDKEHDTSEKYSESFLSDFEKEEDFEGDQMSEGLNDTEQEISYLVDSDNEQLEESFEGNNVLLEVTSEERLESHHEEEDIEEKTELLEIAEQQQRVEDEIRELKSKISSPIEDYLSALEEQGQEIRPPPPYSSPSLDFLLYSMQFSDSALTKDMILQAIHSHADEMWDAWESTGKLVQNYSSSVEPEDLSTTEVPDEDDEEANSILYLKYAERCSQTFVNTAVREGIEQALYIKELDTDIGFVDTLRKGQFAVHALRHKRPKSKSDLVKAVYNQIIKFFPDLQEPKAASSEEMKAEKWCCKPRDKVENHLVSDMLDYEPQWLDVWPETLLIADDAAEMIAVESLQEVIANFETAMNHE